MPKVEIDTPGVTVRLEADEISVSDLAKLALATYRDAGGWPQQPTPGTVGFIAERSEPKPPPDTSWIEMTVKGKK